MSDDQEDRLGPEVKATGILTDPVSEVTCGKCGCEIDVADLESFIRVECPDCGNIEIVPARLGQYLLLDLIGAGGMGGVYHAKDPSLSRFVAVKVMLRSLGADVNFVENFKREAQAAARLNHPNIVQIYSFGQEKGQPYIVMELVPGEGLDKQMDGGRQLSQPLVVKVGLDIAEGLKAADEAGLIHGDIKPENILFDDKMNAKLVDFGIASFAKQNTGEGGIWGTPYYIAPEKVRRQKVDARSDIYSLGATLYHALAGKPPFDGRTPVQVVKARLERPARPLSEIRPNIDKQVEKAVMRMLQTEPSMRYPTYASLISDLRRMLKVLGSGHRVTGTKTGRLVVPKRHAVEAVVDEPAQPRITKRENKGQLGGTKIVIARRTGGQGYVGGADIKGRNAVVLPSAPGKVPVKNVKKGSRGAKWFRFILMSATVIGGLVGWLVYQHNQTTEILRNSRLLGQKLALASNSFQEVQGVISNIVAVGRKADGLHDKTTNAVFVVLGEPFDWPMPETKPEAPKAKPAAGAPKAKAVADALKAEAAKEDAGGDDAPPGEASRAMLDKQRNTLANRVVKEEAPKEAPKDAAVEKAKVEPKKDAADDPKSIKAPAKKALRQVADIHEKMASIGDLDGKATAVRDEAYKAYNEVVRMGRDLNLKGARAAVQAMDARVKVLGEHKNSAEALKLIVDGMMADLEKYFKTVEEMRVEHVKRVEEERKAQEEAELQKKLEEERKLKEEQYQAQVKTEQNLVVASKIEVQLLMKQFKYKEAVAKIKEQLAAVETKEGKSAAQLLIDQYGALVSLKDFLIERMNADPFEYGYGAGPSARDILGADDGHLKVKDRMVPWSEVNVKQMLKIIDHYLASKKIKSRDQAEQSLGAAIYCVENGGGTDGAKRTAAEYARKTLELRPNMEEDVKRLLPADVLSASDAK